jgi:hypothetical protein
MKRRLTAILAGTGLLAIIIGLPALLIATANVAAPHHGWTPAGLWQALLAPDDGTLLVTIVKLAGWISWAILTATILLEVASRARNLPVPQLRGMAWPQHLARTLVTAVLAGFIATNNITTSAPDPTIASPLTPTAIPLAATLPAHPPAKTTDHARSYTVKRGDTLSEIALNTLGDGHAYPRIYNASTHTVQPDGRRLTDPDLIIPGWKLTIPTRHTHTPAAPDPDKHSGTDQTTTSKPVPIPAETIAATTPPAPSAPAASAPTRTAPTTTAPDPAAPAPVDAESADHELATPAWLVAGLVGAGSLLAGALWLMLQRRRRAQWRARRPGRSIVVPAPGYAPIEKTLEQAGAPTGDIVTAIDQALRRLAATLHDTRHPIPTLAELTVTTENLTARFTSPVTLPAPWQPATDSTQWTVERSLIDQTGELDPDDPPAWPQLVTIGIDDHDAWHLINLEAFGVITLTGDPDYTTDLARYLLAELAVTSWARDLQIDCAGIGAELTNLNPARIHHHPPDKIVADTVATAVETCDRMDAAHLNHLEEARTRQAADQLWDSHILITTPATPDLPVLIDLITAQPGRTATTVLVVGPAEAPAGVEIRVDDGGRVQIPSLSLDLIANGLTPGEALGCAAVLAAADTLDDTPTPIPEHPTQKWEELCDATGHLRPDITLDRGAEPDTEASSLLPGSDEDWTTTTANTEEDLALLAPLVPVEIRIAAEAADPSLDADLEAWAADTCDRPRLSVFGPMRLRVGPGGNPAVVAHRKPFYTGIVAYLAHTRGATTDEIATAMKLTPRRVRKDMYILRQWLGDKPGTQDHYLPGAASNMGAAEEGVGLYVIEDLLDDADLFRRLRLRGEARGADGLPDLLTALRLVRGTPYADRSQHPRPWLTDKRPDHHLQTAVVDVAHLVTSIAVKAGDLHQARAAAELALLIAPDETTPALDLANVAIEQGREDEAATLIRTINTWTDQTGEPPLELPERADRILRTHRWLEPAERAG